MSMPLPLRGKVALVTGAAQGIGRGVSLVFVEQGCTGIVLNDLPTAEPLAQELITELRQLRPDCQAVFCAGDVSKVQEVQGAVDAAVRTFGRLDIAVANAVWSDRGPFLEADLEAYRQTMDVCYYGAVHLAQCAARQMQQQHSSAGAEAGAGGVGGGSIVLMSSIMGSTIVGTGACAYSSAKAAITHLGLNLAAELAPSGIRVNVVAPGWCDTPGERKWTPEHRMAELARGIPLPRLGTGRDVGSAVAFLCSDAAGYITGAVLPVDGGYTVGMRLPTVGACTFANLS